MHDDGLNRENYRWIARSACQREAYGGGVQCREVVDCLERVGRSCDIAAFRPAGTWNRNPTASPRTQIRPRVADVETRTPCTVSARRRIIHHDNESIDRASPTVRSLHAIPSFLNPRNSLNLLIWISTDELFWTSTYTFISEEAAGSVLISCFWNF